MKNFLPLRLNSNSIPMVNARLSLSGNIISQFGRDILSAERCNVTVSNKHDTLCSGDFYCRWVSDPNAPDCGPAYL